MGGVGELANTYQPIPPARHAPKISPTIPKRSQLVTRTEVFTVECQMSGVGVAPVGQDVLRYRVARCIGNRRHLLPRLETT